MGLDALDGLFVGIDLGTACSCLAYTKGDGKPLILSFDGGTDILPSVVTFSDEGIHVGGCEEKATSWNTVSHFKRVLGENVYRTFNGVRYSPTELSALILTKMLNRFREVTGETVKNAVITIPSDYGDVERHSTYNAAKIAGLERVFLLSESLAAAISYGMENFRERERNIIIYDLGSGTLDVAVVKMSGSRFTVLADESDKGLGGMDWDLQLATTIQKKVLDSLGMDRSKIISDSEFRMDILAETERVKKALDEGMETKGTISVNDGKAEFTITRDDFEESTKWLISKTIDMITRAVMNSKLTMSDIDAIILAGASSRMHQVREKINEAFPSSDISIYRPQYAVARGAALYAEARYGDSKVEATPVMTKSYGFMAGIDGVEKVCNVVFKNSQIPSEGNMVCMPKRDDQRELQLDVYESFAKANEMYIDPGEAKLVKSFVVPLKGKVSRGSTRIPIRISVNQYGKVTFQVKCNGEITELSFIDEIMMDEAEIEESRLKMGALQ